MPNIDTHKKALAMRAVVEHVIHPNQSFKFLHFQVEQGSNNAGAKWHSHRQCELTWLNCGNGIRFVGDNAAPFLDGDLVLLGSYVPHCWLLSPPKFDAETALKTSVEHEPKPTATVLQFPIELLLQNAFPELQSTQSLLEQARFGLLIQGQCKQQITPILQAMQTMTALERLAAFMQILTQYPQQLIPIASSAIQIQSDDNDVNLPFGGKQIKAQSDNVKRIQHIIEWIHNNLDSALEVEQAASIACISKAAFSRFFKRETGKTFSTYVSEVRCSAACLQLKKTDKPIALIAEQCGFATLSNFNRQFSARVGKTPREYRQ